MKYKIDKIWNSLRKLIIGTGIVLLAILSLANSSGAQTNINSCTDISMPGEYILNQDIIHSANRVCINITSSDVIFNGSGHIIDGSGSQPNGTAGIIVVGSNNVTVENTILTNWESGIGYSISDNGNITNNSASSNNAGIVLDTSSNNTIKGNNASSNLVDGIFMTITFNHSTFTNNVLTENIINNNFESGIFIDTVGNNTLSNNIILNNGIGVISTFSDNNSMSDNNISTNNLSIRMDSSNFNTVKNNTISSGFGINLHSSNNNIIYNNYFNNGFNAVDDGNNTWNVTKQLATNIIGGPFIGGNFWSDYTGNDTDGDRIGDTLVPYNNSGSIQNGGDFLPLTIVLGVTQNVTGGATVTTDTNNIGTSPSNPVITQVTSPIGGTITIQESPTTQIAPSGFSFLNQEVNISAPPATPSSPLTIVFTINSTQLNGQNQNTTQIFKNGTQVGECPGSMVANPDPCISNRATLANGDIQITVLSSSGDPWNIAIPVIIQFNATKDFRSNVDLSIPVLGTLLSQNGTKYNVSYVTKPQDGTVSSTNPGQFYGVITLNGTGVSNVTINDTFGAVSGSNQFMVNPAKLGGGVEVIRVNITTGNAVDITNTTQITSANVNNTAGTVNLAINLTTPLASDENLMIYIKFMTALKGSLPNTNDFVNTAVITANSSTKTAAATINFV